MSHRIDQLFKNKLSEHSLPPDAGTWAKIRAGKKNKVIIYWRAAAVILLSGLLVFAWYLLSGPAELAPASLTQTEDNQVQPPVPEQKSDKQPVNQSAIAQAEGKSSVTTQQKKEVILPPDNKKTPVKNEEATQPIAELIEKDEIIETSTTVTVSETTKEKAIVIEFSLPAVTETLPADEYTSASTPEKSGIVRLLETARDVKNGEAAFESGLRTIRNELLAFDLKKDKTRRN